MDDDSVGCLFGGMALIALVAVGAYFLGFRAYWAGDTIRATALMCQVPYKRNVCEKPGGVVWFDFRINRARGTVAEMSKDGLVSGLSECQIFNEENWHCRQPTWYVMQRAWLTLPIRGNMRFVRLRDGRWLRYFGPPNKAFRITKHGDYETTKSGK